MSATENTEVDKLREAMLRLLPYAEREAEALAKSGRGEPAGIDAADEAREACESARQLIAVMEHGGLMSDAEYAEAGGVCCPVCRSDNIEGISPFETTAGAATQDCACNQCGAHWTDSYTLTNYTADDETFPDGRGDHG